MRAKCRICGEPLDTNTAYLVVTNGKKAYYCSQEEYEADQTKKKKAAEDKDKVYRLVCDIIARKEITNTALFVEWKVWNKVADNEKIGMYLEENKEFLCNTIARLEDKEFNRIRYLSAILKNKLGDYKPSTTVKAENTPIVTSVSSFELFEPTIKKQEPQNNFILEDVEDDLL